jgi:hypothetical protein
MQKIHLDISEKTLPQIVYAKQFDVGRKFIVALYDSGTPYTIPESATLSVGYAAADGKNAGNFSGAVASENTIEITVDEIMTSTAGNGVLSVTLLHENGNEISTWNIPYFIEMQPGSFPIAPSPNTVNLTKAVLFSAQNLTDAQKEQARKNIGVTASGGGGSGEPGADGFSPVATVTQTDEGAVISITDKNGTTTATVANGKDGTSATHSWNGTTLTITSASGTSSANLKGEPGKDGNPGKDGSAGADGVSPTVAVSKSGKVTTLSITDKNGTKTATINDGADGSPGSAGKDGTSVTHSWSGTTLSITSASGTSSANLKGEKGDKGDTGAAGVSVSSVKQTTTSSADGGSNVVTVTLSNGTTSTFTVKNGSKGSTGAAGKTPVKGTDYWTAEDKESMIQDVISALGGSPIFGVVDSNNNIVITGNLADGIYTLKYEDAEGVQTDIGTLTLAPEVTYTNLFDPATASINTRMSGGSKAPKTENGYVMTALIPIPLTAVTGSSTTSENFIAVPSTMWTGSANMFLSYGSDITTGYVDANTTKGTVVGNWVKIPLVNQYSNSFNCSGVTISLKVGGSALTASDIQNIEIYFNEIPE